MSPKNSATYAVVFCLVLQVSLSSRAEAICGLRITHKQKIRAAEEAELQRILDKQDGRLDELESMSQSELRGRNFLKLSRNGYDIYLHNKLTVFDDLVTQGFREDARSYMIDNTRDDAPGMPQFKDVATLYRNSRASLVVIEVCRRKIAVLESLLGAPELSDKHPAIKALITEQEKIITYRRNLMIDSYTPYMIFYNHLERIRTNTDCPNKLCTKTAAQLQEQMATADFLFENSGWWQTDKFIAQISEVLGPEHSKFVPGQDPLGFIDVAEVSKHENAMNFAKDPEVYREILRNKVAKHGRYALKVFFSEPFISKLLYDGLGLIPIVGKTMRDSTPAQKLFRRLIDARAALRDFYILTRLLRSEVVFDDAKLAARIQHYISDFSFLQTFTRRNDFIPISEKLILHCEQHPEYLPLAAELKKAREFREKLGKIDVDYQFSPVEQLGEVTVLIAAIAGSGGIYWHYIDDKEKVDAYIKQIQGNVPASEEQKEISEAIRLKMRQDPKFAEEAKKFLLEQAKQAQPTPAPAARAN